MTIGIEALAHPLSAADRPRSRSASASSHPAESDPAARSRRPPRRLTIGGQHHAARRADRDTPRAVRESADCRPQSAPSSGPNRRWGTHRAAPPEMDQFPANCRRLATTTRKRRAGLSAALPGLAAKPPLHATYRRADGTAHAPCAAASTARACRSASSRRWHARAAPARSAGPPRPPAGACPQNCAAACADSPFPAIPSRCASRRTTRHTAVRSNASPDRLRNIGKFARLALESGISTWPYSAAAVPSADAPDTPRRRPRPADRAARCAPSAPYPWPGRSPPSG